MYMKIFITVLSISFLVFGSAVYAEGVATPGVVISKNISVGAKGKDVTQLQQYLVAVGFLKTNATGYFGPSTLKAVKAFQLKNGIKATGFVGPQTRSFIAKGSYQEIVPLKAVNSPKPTVSSETKIPTISSVTSSMYPLHIEKQVQISGTNLDNGDTIVNIVGNNESYKTGGFDVKKDSVRFFVPDIPKGDYSLYLDQSGKETNRINVSFAGRVYISPQKAFELAQTEDLVERIVIGLKGQDDFIRTTNPKDNYSHTVYYVKNDISPNLSDLIKACTGDCKAPYAIWPNSFITGYLKNMKDYAKIAYDASTPPSYAGVCTNEYFASYFAGIVGGASGAVCNNSATAWAVSVPLLTPEGSSTHWCSDSTGVTKGTQTALQPNQMVCQ